ncbi:N-acyl homoserine lactonase family protein [Sphingomonas sp. LaA6.9]|uniref:N-acyl homoserine lactonase family protein n=1 Tax=Sphingomonas sp. LaA6.9 TaxID=2919914 RepID=UPI001F4FF18A|nr:N-acyl homoserine lactonase family protein [Sphingomonas sp. LaA6.9]MCJ8158385.1 N-acyl homoserine lactonase family protein [Sphingomonas sp. LaA6.9]
MKRVMALLFGGAILSGIAAWTAMAQGEPKITLQAFECGRLKQNDLGRFSDTMRFKGEAREFIAGCFLVRHPKGVLLWDTGFSAQLIGMKDGPPGLTLDKSLTDRLTQNGIQPGAITHVGISHYHADHSGGAGEFPNAELLIGEGDWAALAAMKPDDRQAVQLAHWLSGKGKVRSVKGDLDVFGDGTVTMLAMPGHTPGHSALLVRLPKNGAMLLTGDQYHFRENRAVRGVPTFNTNRADTLASHDRFEEIAKNLKARVIIQHDPRDMAELPAFPAALD